MNIDEEVGRIARAIRQTRGVDRQHMADELGVSESEIEDMENGRVRIGAQRLLAYCRVLNVPVSVFFEWQGDRLRLATEADRYLH